MEKTLHITPHYVLVAVGQFISWCFFGKKWKSIFFDFFLKAENLCQIRTAREPLDKSDRLFVFFWCSCDKSSAEPLLPMFFSVHDSCKAENKKLMTFT